MKPSENNIPKAADNDSNDNKYNSNAQLTSKARLDHFEILSASIFHKSIFQL